MWKCFAGECSAQLFSGMGALKKPEESFFCSVLPRETLLLPAFPYEGEKLVMDWMEQCVE